MNLQEVSILFITGSLLIIGEGCQTSGTTVPHEEIDPDQVTNAIVTYRIMDQQTMLFDSVILPSPVLNRFVQSWNTSEQAEMRKYVPSFTIKIQLKDSNRRSFRLNGNYAKEKNDWSYQLSDTTVQASLDSLRAFNERWNGTYATDNNAQLTLHRNGVYEYSFDQCIRGAYSHGTWTTSGDTLHLRANSDSLESENAMFKYAQFNEPFVLKGRQLYFTVEGELNYHYFFTKE